MQHGFEESGDVQDIRLVVDTIPTLAWSAGPDGSAQFFNQRWLDYTGLSAEQALGSGWQVAIHPDELPRILETFREALNSVKPYEVEGRFRRFDGEFRWFLFRGSPLRDRSGKVAKWYGTNTDLEERKRAEDALRKSEERWRSVFENSAIGVALTDFNGHFLATNHVFQAMVGYTEEELRAVNFLDLTHEDYREANWALITELLEGKRRQFQIEKKYRHKDGGSIWVSNNVSLVPGTERAPRFIMALTEDITQRKRAEEKLRQTEADLLEAQRISQTGSWKLDASSGTVTVSPQIFRIFGVKPDEDTSTVEFWLSRNHPEDQKRIQELFERSTIQKTDYEADYRIVLPDGAIKHLHAVGHPVLNKSGDLVEFVGTAMDITERKQKEEALRRSEGYLAEAQKLTHTGSWAAHVYQTENVSWSNFYWSEELYRIFGFDPGPTPPSEVEIGERLHPEDVLCNRSVVEQAIRGRSDFEVDYRLVLPSGPAKYIHVVGHPIVNASGDVIEIVGTAMDITERKRAEDALRASEAFLLEAQRLTRTCSWRHEVLSGKVTVSAEGFAMFGIEPKDDASSVDFYHSRKHPKDRPEAEQAYAAALLRKSDFEADFRIVLPDGTIKNIHTIGHPILDERGDVVEFVGASIDVTEHHRARADLERALEEIKRLRDQLQNENVVLREQIDQAFMFEEIVGASPGLQEVLSRVTKVAPTDSSVLVSGETGTGKELIARAIHKRSRRSQRAFVSVNCAALAPSLISSELFGHEKGAFTGAMQRRLGRFELANGGTIFLDEIGELPLDTQVALLRVLQEREFERVGGTQAVKIDVRVIAATNRDLEAAVANGTFRPDLYYRLNVFPIQVPPLRERQDDVLMLLEHFVHRFAQKMGKHLKKIDKRTVELFRSYPWPGNIRELQNVVERSVIVSSDDAFSVDAAWLSKDPRRVALPKQPKPADTDEDARRERQIIEEALAGSRGRVSGPNGAAARLRVPPSTLEHRIKKLRIRKSHFKLS
jgi:PAS domain S-box-containing protein